MFDVEKIKRESSLSNDDVTRLVTRIRNDFREDELMFELHFLRALKALGEGWITVDDIGQEAEVSS